MSFTFIPIKGFNKEEKEILFISFVDYDWYQVITLKKTYDYLIDLLMMLIIDKFSPSYLALVITFESFAEKLY